MKKILRLRTVMLLLYSVAIANSQKTYDFIVVGAGAGGCAVARRLVENGRFSVLLIESGGSPKEGYDVPAYAPRFTADPEITFRLQSTPQKNVGLLTNGVVPLIAGRELGGTTSINSMWFNRGSPHDWNHWAEVTGDDSWRYDNMLKYFKQSEKYEGDFPSDQHGYNGPITVSRPRYSPGLEFWLAAGRELGYPVGDPNGPQKLSFTPVEFSKRHGRRVSAFLGYIAPVLHLSNLHVLTNANVTQVIFQGNRAVGVNFISNATQSFAKATKEVILSAGSFSSPVILQRSGIGPRHVLQPAKIPIVRELPTGENYHAHPSVNLNFAISNASFVMDEQRDLTPDNLEFFNLFGDGPFSSHRGATGQALVASSVAKGDGTPEWPDIQLCMSHSTLPFVSYADIHLTARRLLKKGEVPISCSIFLGRPKSRGSVKVDPDNILGAPIVDLNYLSDSRDFEILLDGIEETLRVFEGTKAYRSLTARYTPVALTACDQFPVKSTDYWLCYIRQTTGGACHPVGTNKMGKPTDPTAVVDSELRVIGMDGLRVVDASIMPSIVNANPQADVYAIAEKVADLILNKWQGKVRSSLRGEYDNERGFGWIRQPPLQSHVRSPFNYKFNPFFF